MNNIVLEIDSVTKRYATGAVAVEALKNVSVTIKRGTLTAIIGPSGSGKSTLMHIIGCLDIPSEGRYVLDGVEVSKLPLRSLADIRLKKIGFVFQSFNLLPYLTAYKNIELPLIFAGMRATKRSARVRELLDLVGMTARAGHKPSQMSGGEQQRIAIARALANDPEIILADEPTGNLDTKNGESIMQLFMSLWEAGKTLVMITHDPGVAERCEKKVHLLDGRIEKVEECALRSSE